MASPKLIQVSVQSSRGGKVAIEEYGAVNSDWHYSLSRTYEAPADWTDEDADAFQIAKQDELAELLDPLDQAAYDERYAQRTY